MCVYLVHRIYYIIIIIKLNKIILKLNSILNLKRRKKILHDVYYVSCILARVHVPIIIIMFRQTNEIIDNLIMYQINVVNIGQTDVQHFGTDK